MFSDRAVLGDRWGLVSLRVVVGALFIVHGFQKVLAGAGGPGFARSLQGMGFTPGIAWAVLITLVELGGGICLLLGIFVRPAAALITIEMLVAVVKVNFRRGFYWTQGGWEMPALLALLAAILALTTPSTLLRGSRRTP
jgi:putative oxidoreductase